MVRNQIIIKKIAWNVMCSSKRVLVVEPKTPPHHEQEAVLIAFTQDEVDRRDCNIPGFDTYRSTQADHWILVGLLLWETNDTQEVFSADRNYDWFLYLAVKRTSKCYFPSLQPSVSSTSSRAS